MNRRRTRAVTPDPVGRKERLEMANCNPLVRGVLRFAFCFCWLLFRGTWG